ncbi:MAG: pyridoxal phosphate-dependent aminotransferase, partial [Bdellovibrionales bacterium]|nr:pyridoxal phosphate-dependent aminotransferase [Bdellovibrionales bacterium]
MILSLRGQALKPSPTLALAAKAKELTAAGHDVISLSVGEPDWDTYDNVKAAGIDALKEGMTKYTPASGIPELRKVIAEVEGASLKLEYKPSQVTVSSGAKFILFSALQMLINPGDEVLIPAPYWVSYPTMVELADGKPVMVPSTEETGFRVRKKDLEAKVTSKTKVLILNSPSNPSGVVYSEEDLKEIGQFLESHPHVLLISDDIYNRLSFASQGISAHILHQFPHLKDRVIVVNGLSKTYSMTGWRLGWAMGPELVINAMSNYQSQSVSCVAGFTQVAAIEALQKSGVQFLKTLAELERRRDFIFTGINDIP